MPTPPPIDLYSLNNSDCPDVYQTIADAAAAVGGFRSFRTGSAGTLVVTRARDGAQVALPCAAAERQPVIGLAVIAAGSSGCVPITLYR